MFSTHKKSPQRLLIQGRGAVWWWGAQAELSGSGSLALLFNSRKRNEVAKSRVCSSENSRNHSRAIHAVRLARPSAQVFRQLLNWRSLLGYESKSPTPSLCRVSLSQTSRRFALVVMSVKFGCSCSVHGFHLPLLVSTQTSAAPSVRF